jgi:ABC transport system ATP-binding/permease protein
VVVKFDKLNPMIGNTATVPLVGDLMASRWAFEAAMVSQYKDNKFEKEFYQYDKVMADADYKKIYMIPELESRLDFVNLQYKNTDPLIRTEVEKELALMNKSILGEQKATNISFDRPENLAINKFDSATYARSISYFEKIKKFYVQRYNKADDKKENMIAKMTNTTEKEKTFVELKKSYQNEAITEFVRNTMETNRIIEKDGKLVQKIFPIYKDPDPDHMVDFDAQFYMPAKHFSSILA